MPELFLNFAAFVERTRVNGPGLRTAIWLKGCCRRCPGCANPDLWDASPAELQTPEHLAVRVLALEDVEGVTYTGGEPFLQARGLVVLSKLLRAKGLSTVCYSGYRLEDLTGAGDPDWTALLGELDVLIDGEYRVGQRKPLLWRGSANQRVHFLSERYLGFSGRVDEASGEFEIHLVDDKILLTGFIREEMVRAVKRSLAEDAGLGLS